MVPLDWAGTQNNLGNALQTLGAQESGTAALLRTIAASAGTRPFLVPFPFSFWHVIGYVSETLPGPPITRNQVELMERDNIPEPDAPGFEDLQISPQAIENILPQMLQTLRGPPVA